MKKQKNKTTYKLIQQTPKRTVQQKKRDPFKERGVDNFVDFKDVRLLTRFLNEQGKILPARITGATAKMQRKLSTAVKRARHLALITYVSEGTKF